ncbi:MAG: hypothetical protein FWC93_05230 [Defluviitaleaceae bacterium]|nr:hypothetical protein [Defluviitaleaceae bacterium]
MLRKLGKKHYIFMAAALLAIAAIFLTVSYIQHRSYPFQIEPHPCTRRRHCFY